MSALGEVVEELLEGHGGAVESPGELLGALGSAVGDQDAARAAREEVLGGELAHLARADHEDGLAFELSEDLLGQLHRRVGDRNGGAADGRIAPDALGDGEGVHHGVVERPVHRPGLAGDGVGALHLAEDLRLADQHRIETGGDAEEVVDDLLLAAPVEVRFVGAEVAVVIFAQKLAQRGLGARASCVLTTSSTRLQVERIIPSTMPGERARPATASARRVSSKFIRSRTSTGAVR